MLKLKTKCIKKLEPMKSLQFKSCSVKIKSRFKFKNKKSVAKFSVIY